MNNTEPLNFAEAAKTIATWRRPLLISHTKPDGDAIGALIAMRMLLCSPGVEPRAVLFDDLPRRYEFLERFGRCLRFGTDIKLDELADIDGIIVLDTCSYSQLEPVAEWLRSATVTKLVVDHHATRDDLADLYLIDDSAAATCLILYDWMQAACWPIRPETAVALYVGIVTDTGWFRHCNTDGRVLAAAADLVRRGARPHELFDHLYQQESKARFRLRVEACHRLELRAGGRLAIMTLPAGIFEQCGAVLADTEDLVNEPLRLGSVVVSIILVEQGDGVIRVGFRSRQPAEAPDSAGADIPDIDVAAIAQGFGGGGHRRAAGARLTGALDQVQDRVIAQVEAALTDP